MIKDIREGWDMLRTKAVLADDENLIKRLPVEIMDPVSGALWASIIEKPPLDPYNNAWPLWSQFKAYWLDQEQSQIVAVFQPGMNYKECPSVCFQKCGDEFYPIKRTDEIEEKMINWRILDILGHGEEKERL